MGVLFTHVPYVSKICKKIPGFIYTPELLDAPFYTFNRQISQNCIHKTCFLLANVPTISFIAKINLSTSSSEVK